MNFAQPKNLMVLSAIPLFMGIAVDNHDKTFTPIMCVITIVFLIDVFIRNMKNKVTREEHLTNAYACAASNIVILFILYDNSLTTARILLVINAFTFGYCVTTILIDNQAPKTIEPSTITEESSSDESDDEEIIDGYRPRGIVTTSPNDMSDESSDDFYQGELHEENNG